MMSTLVESVKRAWRRTTAPGDVASRRSSCHYRVLRPEEVPAPATDGWHEDEVALRQEAAYRPLLEAMYAGKPRQDFVAVSTALGATDLADPTVLEVGCGSGYYSAVLAHLLGRPVRYTGLDYSAAMVRLAQKRYPQFPFHVGDATKLEFGDGAFDVVINGGSLIHIPDYAAAIREARRVARAWCIFHTVVLLDKRPTTHLTKHAYGRPATEVILNRGEFLGLLDQAGLEVRGQWPSVDYNLEAELGEPTRCVTMLCRVR